MSKTALIRLSESLAQETAEEGIKVFAIHPGTVRTPMNDYVHDSPKKGKRAPWLGDRSGPSSLKEAICRSSNPNNSYPDWLPAMPMGSPVGLLPWRKTLTR